MQEQINALKNGLILLILFLLCVLAALTVLVFDAHHRSKRLDARIDDAYRHTDTKAEAIMKTVDAVNRKAENCLVRVKK